jgi:hypothetical protein
MAAVNDIVGFLGGSFGFGVGIKLLRQVLIPAGLGPGRKAIAGTLLLATWAIPSSGYSPWWTLIRVVTLTTAAILLALRSNKIPRY